MMETGIEILYKGVVEMSLEKVKSKGEWKEGAEGAAADADGCAESRPSSTSLDRHRRSDRMVGLNWSRSGQIRHVIIFLGPPPRTTAPAGLPRGCHASDAAGLLCEAMHPAGQLARQGRLEAASAFKGLAKEVACQITASASRIHAARHCPE